MRINVKETPTLCERCEQGHVMRTERKTISWCHCVDQFVEGVKECNSFREQSDASPPYRMEKIGWVLEVKKGVIVGFRPPGKEEKEV
jgi:hypothetical protein